MSQDMESIFKADAEVRTGPFIIFVSKKPDEGEIAFECRRKGFLVGGSLKTKSGFGFILSMSPKLVVKMALEVGLPLQPLGTYSNLERLALSSAAIKIIERAKSIDVEDVWLSHDKNMLKEVDASVGDAHLSDIKQYYGSKIAMYFGWLAFYTKILAVPSIAGVLLFGHQMYLGDVDSIWVPFFCVLIAIWSTYFLEFWKRRGNELSFNWKVYGVEDEDAEHDLAKAAAKAEGNIAVRQMLSFVTVLSLMYVMIRIMLYYKSMQVNANTIYGEDSYYKYYPTLLYSILPAVATMAFEPIAAALNKFEGHITKTDAENSRIMKYFALEFVNRYCALFHAAFWLKDLDVLRSLLISLLTINALLNNAIELGMPMIKSYLNRLENRKKMKKQEALKNTTGGTVAGTANGIVPPPIITSSTTTASPAVPSKNEDAELKNILEEELAFSDYDLNADYLEIVIQYGYVTMFVVAFPLAPALALLNNIFESKVDLFKLTECRRPRLLQRSNIGSWQHCMEFISFLSVITNCYLIVMVSTHFEMIVPEGLEPYVQNENGRLIAMMVMEHVLLGFKIMMMFVIDDVPRWIREAIAQQHSQQREASTKERINLYAEGELDPQKTLSPRNPRRASHAMAFIQSFAGRTPRAGVPAPNAAGDVAQNSNNLGGNTPRLTSANSAIVSASSAKSPSAMSSERDDVSVLTSETERPHMHKRAAKFLSHLTGRSHTKHGSAATTPTATAPAPAAPVQLTQAPSQTLPAVSPRPGLSRAQDSLLDEVAEYTEFPEPGAARTAPSLSYTLSMESMENEETTWSGGGVRMNNKSTLQKETPVDRLVKETASPFGFDPVQMMILICLPMALQYFNITPWLYLPLAVLFFGYLQQKKDRIDRKMAMGIVTDPTLLRLILEEMPSWPIDGEFQQLEWVNYMMQKFWPMLAIVGEEKALRIGQPILNRMKPSFLSELTIKKFNFGTIAPRFLGIRMIGTREEEGVIRCDLEMRYAGDPQIIIQVGPTVVEILNLRISCTMRCEMLEFTPRMTPFKLASATMMKKPFVDFNIKVAGMDIMSTRAMTNLVHNLFHKVLHTVCMYPKKIFVPMGPNDPNAEKVDIEAYKVLNPVGILYLTLERGVDLIQANVFGSDPYVDIETTDQDMRSSIIYNTVNPEWNETYDIIVYDRRSQVVSFTVMDFDMANNTKCLGKAEFEVNKVPFNTTVQKALTLTGVTKGTLVVSCTYIPMSSAYKTNTGGNGAIPTTAAEKARQNARRMPRSVFKGASQADDEDSGEKDVLFDLPIEELNSDEMLITGDLALQKIDEPSPMTPLAHAGLGILTISSIRLRSIRAGATGNWKPCVSFHVGVMKKQTHSKKNIVNPEFEERFAFVVKDRSMMDRILVKVMDKKKIMTQSRQIGEASVNLYDLLHMGASGQAATIDKEYEVVSENVEYMVGFKMQWFSANK